MTGDFFLARLAAAFSVLAPSLASWPPEFSRCARTNHWNFSSSLALDQHVLRNQVEVFKPVDGLTGVLDDAGVDQIECGEVRLHGVPLD